MATHEPTGALPPEQLRLAHVLRVDEDACQVWSNGEATSVRFAPMFPTPRTERVSPGHLVAVAKGPTGSEVVVWRWYDAVVLGQEHTGTVRLWEPAHGEVVARPRASYGNPHPGSRAYASAGLPGADWWVEAGVDAGTNSPPVEIDEIVALYTRNDLWSAAFAECR